MRSRLLFVSMVLMTTAAMGDTIVSLPTQSADAHAQAAALLSRPQTFERPTASSQVRSSAATSTATDGHAQAAALLNGPSADPHASFRSSSLAADAQAKAARLLRR